MGYKGTLRPFGASTWAKFKQWLRPTRSKSEIQAKITQITDEFIQCCEGMTIEQSQRLRDFSNGMTTALDWVIKDRESL
jgi:hypothetical protein